MGVASVSFISGSGRSVAFLYNGYCISLFFFFWSRAILFNYERAQCLESHLKFSICGKLCYLVHKKSRHSTYIIIAWSNKSNYINLEFHSIHPLQLRKQGTPNFQHYKVFHENFFKTRTHYNYTITIYLSLPKGTPSYCKI